ncbi:MAG: L,D-transpeptidase family protein [Pseudomonadota bacterium]
MSFEDLVVTPTGCRFRGRLFPCSIGWGGVTRTKREGDGATPTGAHRLIAMTYRADRMVCPTRSKTSALPARPTRLDDIWSDDIADARYNSGLRSSTYPYSHERLWRSDPLYDLVIMTDWNWPDAVPGHGSAIFLHQWRSPGYPTAGCVAFSRSDLRRIVRWLSPRSRLIVQP